MTRSIFNLSLLAATVTALLTVAERHYVQQWRLQEAARLRTENDELRWKISQQREVHLEKADVPGRLTTPASQISRGPGTEYRNEGQATPIAALQTYAWACDHGDTATMIDLIRFDEAARHKAVTYMATLPAEVRARWNSPEAMAAALLIDEGIQDPYPGATILALASIEVIREGRVRLLLPDTTLERTEFQQTSDGWKYVITEKRVDDYIAENNVKAPAER